MQVVPQEFLRFNINFSLYFEVKPTIGHATQEMEFSAFSWQCLILEASCNSQFPSYLLQPVYLNSLQLFCNKGVALRISVEVSADYAEKISQGESQELIRRSRRIQGKKRRVRLVFFKTEDRKILASTLILLHLRKTSCYSTLLNLFFPNYFNLKNELSLSTCPYDYFLILYCFIGTKRATPALDTTLACLLGFVQGLTAASSTTTLECLVLPLAFNNASNSRGHRNEQERASLLKGTSKKSTSFLKYLKTSPSIHSYPLTLGRQWAVNKSRQEPLFLSHKLFFIFMID